MQKETSSLTECHYDSIFVELLLRVLDIGNLTFRSDQTPNYKCVVMAFFVGSTVTDRTTTGCLRVCKM